MAEHRWYAIQTTAGHENKVRSLIQRKIDGDARTPEADAAAVVQEISEAAAQVDSINALTRAQKLHDSSAQAIAMLAVARVVGSNGVTR